MISISCSRLEVARTNPVAFAQMMVTAERQTAGRSGMFSCWKDVAGTVHREEMNMTEGVRELHRKFLQFDDTKRNQARQRLLVEQFVRYCRHYDQMKFRFLQSHHRMNWEMVSDVRLGGLTPWIVENAQGAASYMLSEKPLKWKEELRFPLFQQYVAEKILGMEAQDLRVGIYCLETDEFSLQSLAPVTLRAAKKECMQVLNKISDEYRKSKMATTTR
jgi:hypothetical protein